jgi:hypothetical protein
MSQVVISPGLAPVIHIFRPDQQPAVRLLLGVGVGQREPVSGAAPRRRFQLLNPGRFAQEPRADRRDTRATRAGQAF